jgi:acyl-CoA hydrolase
VANLGQVSIEMVVEIWKQKCAEQAEETVMLTALVKEQQAELLKLRELLDQKAEGMETKDAEAEQPQDQRQEDQAR